MNVQSAPRYRRLLTKLRAHIKRSRYALYTLFLGQNFVSLLLPRQLPRLQPTGRYRLVGMIRIKDEARFVPEWIAHHLGVGFEHIFLYDNGSSDELTRTIKPFLEFGVVTLIDWPGRPISPEAEKHFFATYADLADWVAFLDADEFIVETCKGELLNRLENATGPALVLNWRYYGSSGWERIPPGLVLENFVSADRDLNAHVKSVVKVSQVRRCRNPHGFYYSWGRLGRTAQGIRAMGSFAPCDSAPNESMHINHYVFRSRQDYLAKVSRGFGDRRGELDEARRSSQSDVEFTKHNQVKVEPVPTATTKEMLRDLGYGYPFLVP